MLQGKQKGFTRWDQWEAKLEEIELEQYRTLVENRTVFSQCKDVWAPHDGSYDGAELAEWMTDAYVVYIGTAIRKMSEERMRGNDNLSLVIRLRDVAEHAQYITRSRFQTLYLSKDNRTADDALRRIWIDMANQHFDKYAGVGVDSMTRSEVLRDIEEIEAAVAPVKALVDKVIVHTDRKRPVTLCTFGEINTAIDVLEEKLRRYLMLILGREETMFLTPDVADDLTKIWPFR